MSTLNTITVVLAGLALGVWALVILSSPIGRIAVLAVLAGCLIVGPTRTGATLGLIAAGAAHQLGQLTAGFDASAHGSTR